jgi:L-fuconolactonase
MIVDAHHHFWDPARGDYHWMSPDVPVLARPYGPDDMAPLLRRAGVDRTVLVQAAQTEAETAYLLELAARTPFVAGVVGWLDFEDPAFEDKLVRLKAQPKLVGLRPMLQDLADDAYILRPAVLANLERLVAHDLAFDVLSFPRHLPHVRRALAGLPKLRAVVDHVSKPPIASGELAGWAEEMAAIAGLPNVHCKLSGMVTEAQLDAWRPADLAPFVQHVLAVFGPKRVMFGSDWPVCLRAASYAEVMNALRGIVGPGLDAAATARVFGGNAIAFYKLEV